MGLKLRISAENPKSEFTVASRRFALRLRLRYDRKDSVWGKKKEEVKNERNYKFPYPFSTKKFLKSKLIVSGTR
jgi:hypothetical protein